jgi:predicted RNase H-like HicB family nuclease
LHANDGIGLQHFLLNPHSELMKLKLTAVFRKFPEGYAAFVEELPGANTQGATLEEARGNLVEAVTMVLDANRELAEEELRGQDVIREPLSLTT